MEEGDGDNGVAPLPSVKKSPLAREAANDDAVVDTLEEAVVEGVVGMEPSPVLPSLRLLDFPFFAGIL